MNSFPTHVPCYDCGAPAPFCYGSDLMLCEACQLKEDVSNGPSTRDVLALLDRAIVQIPSHQLVLQHSPCNRFELVLTQLPASPVNQFRLSVQTSDSKEAVRVHGLPLEGPLADLVVLAQQHKVAWPVP